MDSLLGKDENPYHGREGLVYARVSSKGQELYGGGLGSQESRCVKELQNLSISYVRTFPDSFTGGGDFMNRPAMKELLAYVDNNSHKKYVVIFDDLKRFARDVEFHIKLRTAFRVRDVELRCLNYNFDESPEGHFAEVVMAGHAQLEREQNRRQVIQKQRARLEKGCWAFGARRGFVMTRDPLYGKSLKPKYPEAEMIKEALEGFANGTFLRLIDCCKFLVEKGFWTKQSPEKYIDKFKNIITDPLYAGYVEYLKWDVKRRKGVHDGIISLETFEVNQNRLKKETLGRRIRMDISPDFPNRGLTSCFYCHNSLTAAWSVGNGGRFPYYKCQRKGCPAYGKSIPKEKIEKAFGKILRESKLKKEIDKILYKVFDSVWEEEVGVLEKAEHAREKDKVSLNEKIKQLSDRVAKIQSEPLKNAYEQQIEEAYIEIERLEASSTKGEDLDTPYRTALNKASTLLKSPDEYWEKVGVNEKHRLYYFLFTEKLPYDYKLGYRTDKIPSAATLFEDFVVQNTLQVEMGGIEPPCKGFL